MDTPKQVKDSAKALAQVISHQLECVDRGEGNPYSKYWYSLVTIRQYLDDVEGRLLYSLKKKGVYVPSKFDFSVMEQPKKRKKK